MTSSPNVNDLAVRHAEAVCDLGGTHQLVYIYAATHSSDVSHHIRRCIRSKTITYVL